MRHFCRWLVLVFLFFLSCSGNTVPDGVGTDASLVGLIEIDSDIPSARGNSHVFPDLGNDQATTLTGNQLTPRIEARLHDRRYPYGSWVAQVFRDKTFFYKHSRTIRCSDEDLCARLGQIFEMLASQVLPGALRKSDANRIVAPNVRDRDLYWAEATEGELNRVCGMQGIDKGGMFCGCISDEVMISCVIVPGVGTQPTVMNEVSNFFSGIQLVGLIGSTISEGWVRVRSPGLLRLLGLDEKATYQMKLIDKSSDGMEFVVKLTDPNIDRLYNVSEYRVFVSQDGIVLQGVGTLRSDKKTQQEAMRICSYSGPSIMIQDVRPSEPGVDAGIRD